MATKNLTPSWGWMQQHWNALLDHDSNLKGHIAHPYELSGRLEAVKTADANFAPPFADFAIYRILYFQLGGIIGNCKYIIDPGKRVPFKKEDKSKKGAHNSWIHNAVNFLTSVIHAAENRESWATKQVQLYLNSQRMEVHRVVESLIKARNTHDTERFSREFNDFEVIFGSAAGVNVDMPQFDHVREAIRKMPLPSDKNSNLTMDDYIKAVYSYEMAASENLDDWVHKLPAPKDVAFPPPATK